MGRARDALWANGHDESVEVNQRALIDKILARYAGEFTVFRELLQNSDDAQSRAAEIRFETRDFLDRRNGIRAEGAKGQGEQEMLPDLDTAVVHRWTFKNNGRVFMEGDWNRLKKIAEGNPDEEKIGAFGVGFYSLFSMTEEPFVTSGGKWMGFYWKDKGDQLFARRGDLLSPGDSEQDIWTSFEMNLRVPAPIPIPFDLTRFLASSITFMTHLLEVSIYYDDKRLTRLTKESGIPRELGFPGDLQRSSPLGIMNVARMTSTPLHIKAEIMQWSSLETPTRASSSEHTIPSAISTEEGDPFNQTSVSLSIISADVDVRLEKELAAELYRCTKKNAPSKLKCELTYTPKDDYDMSQKEGGQHVAAGNIFQGLQEDLDGVGSARVFIGHATAQTTGLGGHIATRFIPTVERESIDLVDQNVAIWNKELLYIGGFLARSAYEMELADIRSLWEEATTTGSSGLDKTLQSSLERRCLHAMKFFTFCKSTPSTEVSTRLEAAFYACARDHQLPLISTAGVRNASEVRIPDPACSAFLKRLPIIPTEVLEGAQPMILTLRKRGMVKAVTLEDILKELRSRPLTVDEMVAYLGWWVELKKRDGNPGPSVCTELLTAAVLTLTGPESSQGKVVPLASVKTFISGQGAGAYIPQDGPLPDHLLPIAVSSQLPTDTLVSSFPWKDLTVIDWLRFVCNSATGDVEWDINMSALWAERVLAVLANAWPLLSIPDKSSGIPGLLKDKTCVPTSAGLKKPEDSYLASSSLFHDLPVVSLPSGMAVKGTLERILHALGVRKHVDLRVIFDRMVKTGDWTIADLTKYFVTIQSALTTEEWERLKEMAAFSKESDHNSVTPSRYQAKQLYEPLDIFRQLELPVIDWGSQPNWSELLEEAKFLFKLGLLRIPPLGVLIRLCASPHPSVRPIALEYLLSRMSTEYKNYDPKNFVDVQFIPALRGTVSCLGTPIEVFSNPVWATLGFLVVHPSLHQDAQAALRIKRHPLASQLVSFLKTTTPKDEAEARSWFGILAGRISDFSVTERNKLSELPIIPTTVMARQGGKDGPVHWLRPNQCFLGGDWKDEFHSKFFVFVDFGALANTFLLQGCGMKKMPSIEDVTKILLEDPPRFYELADGPLNFLTQLRKIAVNFEDLSSETRKRMKESPVLLGSQSKPKHGGKNLTSSGDFDDDKGDLRYELKRPDQIVIVDDQSAHQFFDDCLFTAPQENILEEFYAKLGSQHLRTLIKDDCQISGEMVDPVAMDTRALILERLPLFLEPNRVQPKFSYDWLESETNFIVKVFRKVSVDKILNHGNVRLCRSRDASAVVIRIHAGPIQLCLRGSSPVDMYEVAMSMCRLLFDSPKPNDALLFTTLLSSDLRSLKRKGYNVDRILKQKDVEALAQGQDTALLSQPLLNAERPARLRNMSSMINLAIGTCRPWGNSGQSENKEEIYEAKLWLGECHGDILSCTDDLTIVGEIDEIKVLVSRDVPEFQNFMARKDDTLQRFSHTLVLLARVYDLPLTRLHIFYHLGGELSAFNWNTTIFVNLRYFEEFHDEGACIGSVTPAYIFWFFTMAHQIAHNLIQPHNLRHELYFSAICEKYIMGLQDLLQSAQGEVQSKKSRKCVIM